MDFGNFRFLGVALVKIIGRSGRSGLIVGRGVGFIRGCVTVGPSETKVTAFDVGADFGMRFGDAKKLGLPIASVHDPVDVETVGIGFPATRTGGIETACLVEPALMGRSPSNLRVIPAVMRSQAMSASFQSNERSSRALLVRAKVSAPSRRLGPTVEFQAYSGLEDVCPGRPCPQVDAAFDGHGRLSRLVHAEPGHSGRGIRRQTQSNRLRAHRTGLHH